MHVFYSIIFLSLFSFSSCSLLNKAPESKKSGEPAGLAIMQGVTGDSWTRIAVLRKTFENMNYEVSDSAGQLIKLDLQNSSWPGSEWSLDELEIQGLNSNQSYQLRVLDSNGNSIDLRTFSVLDSNKTGHSFAIVSCSDDRYPEQVEMWKGLASRKPDFILAIGDNSYADSERKKGEKFVAADEVWRRYAETRNRLQIFREKQLIPIFALWDDHDYGMNNGDMSYPYKEQTKKVFHAFFPQSRPIGQFEPGPGVGSLWKFGKNSFYFLDARSFRSEGGPSPACLKNPKHSLCERQSTEVPKLDQRFSAEQEQWVFERMKKDTNPSIWLVTGDQWLGAYQPFESFDGRHPKSFQKFMNRVKETRRRVVLISGDRHSSEVTKVPKNLLGYETYEIVSSPIHAKVFPSNWIDFPNPLQVSGTAEAFNYTIVRTEVSQEKSWKFNVHNVTKGELTSYSLDLSVPLQKVK